MPSVTCPNLWLTHRVSCCGIQLPRAETPGRGWLMPLGVRCRNAPD
jgi:hypothetical protein